MACSCQWRLTHPRLPRGYGGAGISPGFRQPLTWRSWNRGKWGWQLGANLRWPPPQIHGPRALFLLVSAGFRYKSALETHFHRHRPSRLLDVWASQLRPLCRCVLLCWEVDAAARYSFRVYAENRVGGELGICPWNGSCLEAWKHPVC